MTLLMALSTLFAFRVGSLVEFGTVTAVLELYIRSDRFLHCSDIMEAPLRIVQALCFGVAIYLWITRVSISWARDSWTTCRNRVSLDQLRQAWHMLPNMLHFDAQSRLAVFSSITFVNFQRFLTFLVPYLLKNLLDSVDAGDAIEDVYRTLVLFMIFHFCQRIFDQIVAICWSVFSRRSARIGMVKSFAYLLTLGPKILLGERRGSILAAQHKSASIYTFLEVLIIDLPSTFFDFVIAACHLLLHFGRDIAFIKKFTVSFYLSVSILTTWRRNAILREAARTEDVAEAHVEDVLTCYNTVEDFDGEAFEVERYGGTLQSALRQDIKNDSFLLLCDLLRNGILTLGWGFMLSIVIYNVLLQGRSKGDLALLLAYMQQTQRPLNSMTHIFQSSQRLYFRAEKLLQLFMLSPEAKDNGNGHELDTEGLDIQFHNVIFDHVAATGVKIEEAALLNDVSFICECGTTTAIVGSTGSGKSTIFSLLLRQLRPQSGSIRVNGYDIQDVSLDSLRRHISVAPQDTSLFNDTVAYNVRYARRDASNDQVNTACRRAMYPDAVLNMKVGTRGQALSGGERQRIGFARIYLKDAPAVLLDEATSALDSHTEQMVQEKFVAYCNKKKTVLTIAHRLSSIVSADQILVLGNGRILQSGTHSELLAQPGPYEQMWSAQSLGLDHK